MLRSLPWKNFVGLDGQYLFYGPDSYDHLRRITLGMTSFPAVPSFDSYYGYPLGTGQIWSPVFDYLISALVLLFGGDVHTAHTLGFWLPPVLSFFTIFMVYAAGVRFFGSRAGFVAAGVTALLPGHIIYSLVSELDHHVAEPMVCLAIVISLLKAFEHLDEGSPTSIDCLGTGGLMVFSILIWRGSVIFWGIFFLALAVQIIAERVSGRDAKKLSRYGRNACLFATLLLLPVCSFDLWGTAQGVSFGIISWFHVILLASFAGCLHLLGNLQTTKIKFHAVTVIAVIAAFLVLAPGGKKFLLELLSGISVIGGEDPWLDSISELRPMLFPAGKFDLRHATETMSFLYWLVPAALILSFIRWRNSSFRDFRYSVFIVWGGVLWLIPFFRERYIHLAALATALSAGLLFLCWTERASTFLKRYYAYASACLLLLLLISPSAAYIKDLPNITLPDREKSDLMASLAWLRENTPATSFFLSAEKVPEYGVLSDWSLGAYIDYVARRPTVSTNFGWETHGLFESASFLTSTRPEDAENILRLNKVRYLFLNEVTGNLPCLKSIAEFGIKKSNSTISGQTFNPLATMYYRLYIQNGSAYRVGGNTEHALGKYRLVFESANGFVDPYAGFVSHYKIFELVPGAVMKGRAQPGKNISLKLLLGSQGGRPFTYREETIAGSNGEFTFIIPYATTGNAAAGVAPVGKYSITAGNENFLVHVNEAAIQFGEVIQIN
ncbi:STT3 domain-containing protein [Geotalea toluenoxydans]